MVICKEKKQRNNHERELKKESPSLKSHHEEGNDTGEGNRANELGSRALAISTGGLGNSTSTSSSTVNSRGSVTVNDQISASNTGTVVVDDNGASEHGAVNGLGEGQLGIDVLDGGEGALLGGDNVSVLAGQVTSLAGGQVCGVAGGGADVVGVEVSTGSRAVVVGANGGDVDVVLVSGSLVDGGGDGETLEAGEGDVHTSVDLVKGEVNKVITY